VVQRFRAIEDCDGGLAGAGEFSIEVWVLPGPGFNPFDQLLVSRGSAVESIQLSDGEAYSLNVDKNYQIVNGGNLQVTLVATEWDVPFSPDDRMDDEFRTIAIPAGETGSHTIVIGTSGSGCKVQLELNVTPFELP
jgi:hypothetical protein